MGFESYQGKIQDDLDQLSYSKLTQDLHLQETFFQLGGVLRKGTRIEKIDLREYSEKLCHIDIFPYEGGKYRAIMTLGEIKKLFVKDETYEQLDEAVKASTKREDICAKVFVYVEIFLFINSLLMLFATVITKADIFEKLAVTYFALLFGIAIGFCLIAPLIPNRKRKQAKQALAEYMEQFDK